MSTGKSPHHHIAKSASVIAVATLSSRILGFIRDIIIARLFGVYIYAQAFVIAFKIPNLLRDFVGEGATNAALVPVFSEYQAKHTKEEFWELANVVLNLMLVLLSAITILGIIFSPLLVRLIAPGFASDPEKFALTVKLNRIIFPYILLISLAAYCMGLLNSLKNFAVSAFAPCFLNIAIIVFALWFGESIKGLALGVLVGGVLQLAVQVPALYKKGFRLHLFKRFRHPAAKTIGKLMLPRVASTSIYQLNNFVDSIFGSLALIAGEGAVAALYFSYRLIQFPLGVFSTALAQAALPTLSTQALEDDRANLKTTLSWSLRATSFVMLPASAGFMFLAYPLVSTIFSGGKFDAYSAGLTSGALFFYSIGLFAYAGTKNIQSCFFALKDTVTPTKNALLAFILNVVLCVILMFPLKVFGLALAASISGIISFVVLFARLKRKIGDFNTKDIVVSFLRSLFASLCMGLCCYFVYASTPALNKFLRLALALFTGVSSYFVFCFIFRVREMRQLWRLVSGKK